MPDDDTKRLELQLPFPEKKRRKKRGFQIELNVCEITDMDSPVHHEPVDTRKSPQEFRIVVPKVKIEEALKSSRSGRNS